MRVRESGMPAQAVWEGFFDAEHILKRLQLTGRCRNLLEFGCGYGTFALPAARMISGKVYTLELDPAMLALAEHNAGDAGIDNIVYDRRDFVAYGSGLPAKSVDYVMIFNILHLEDPVALLREAYRNLTDGGLLAIIHWIHNAETPRGPPLDIRPKPEQCQEWAEQAGFMTVEKDIALPPYHYGLVLQRQD
jgi:SAM-dependent methyltransferase